MGSSIRHRGLVAWTDDGGRAVEAVVDARGLGKRYGDKWGLTDVSLAVPPGHVTGLVGPNGAGKSTLLHLITGLFPPTTGSITVAGGRPAGGATQLAKVGFVPQDTPVYAGFSVADHLRLGAHLNPRWDGALARERVEKLGLGLSQKAGRLSGGQRAQLALTLAIAKRPELLVLDEPVASLDPLARRDFLRDLIEARRTHAMSVVLSSHLVGDLERVCDYLILLAASRVQLAGPVDALLAAHRLIYTSGERSVMPKEWTAIAETDHGLLVRVDEPFGDPSPPGVAAVELEDLVLAYMSRGMSPNPEEENR
jgi:ABC-2 type transport system ATP-binding protein